MLKKSHLIGLAITVALGLVLSNLPADGASRLKRFIAAFFVPLVGLAGSAEQLVETAANRTLPKTILLDQLEKLQKENAELQFEAMQAREALRENEQLRKAVAWQQKSPWRVRMAEVIMRDPANWWRNLQINLGSHDGIARNMPVITSEGLIGRVDEVGRHYSRVILLGDPNCRVAAVVENTARDSGIIAPGETSVLDQSLVEMTYLSRVSQVAPGQRVVTSGMGGIFPKGIPIGQIVETNSVSYGLYYQARVRLAASLRQLEYVWVIYE